MAATPPHIVRLEFSGAFDMLDFVQVISDHMSREAGLDEESTHWVGVAVRECVINAIKHGNQSDANKRVFVEFLADRFQDVPELTICVRDEGGGFDPDEIADPLAPENLLKTSGRGIFLIRSFMDDVQLVRVPAGGMEIRMTKRVTPADAPGD
ncbi:MAG: ATP-binding protein [Vicinamibacterales bacterium]